MKILDICFIGVDQLNHQYHIDQPAKPATALARAVANVYRGGKIRLYCYYFEE